MTTPRRLLVDPNTPLCYHIVSRCVRRGWLCGFDRVARRDYSHRKDWLIARLLTLGQAFAVDIYAYSIMSNHFHLVVYYDPTAPARWTDLEVAQRWLQVCPPKHGTIDEGLQQLRLATLLNDPQTLERLRVNLGSLSLFMKLLKQPIARRANLEDQCLGHFFEQRFYSGALLSDEAILAAMAYVDLNPVRAKIARTIAECAHTSIDARLRDPAFDLQDYLRPVVCGVNAEHTIQTLTLAEYVERLEMLTGTPYEAQRQPEGWRQTKVSKWRSQVAALRKRQRAFGSSVRIEAWLAARGLHPRETPLPE